MPYSCEQMTRNALQMQRHAAPLNEVLCLIRRQSLPRQVSANFAPAQPPATTVEVPCIRCRSVARAAACGHRELLWIGMLRRVDQGRLTPKVTRCVARCLPKAKSREKQAPICRRETCPAVRSSEGAARWPLGVPREGRRQGREVGW